MMKKGKDLPLCCHCAGKKIIKRRRFDLPERIKNKCVGGKARMLLLVCGVYASATLNLWYVGGGGVAKEGGGKGYFVSFFFFFFTVDGLVRLQRWSLHTPCRE